MVFIFQCGGAWCIVWGDLAHQIPPVATGLAVCETWKAISVRPVTSLEHQEGRRVFC